MNAEGPADPIAHVPLNEPPDRPDRPGDEDESELCRRAASGDRRAFAQLYERHLDHVYRYAYYRLRDDDAADDVTSEVFHRALVAMPRYEPRRPFLAFLYTIARNVIVDARRRQRPTASFEDAIARASAEPGPEERSADLDEARRLRAAIQTLDPVQQDVIVLRFIAGRSHKEVAAIVGKNENTVRGIQMRALAELRKRLS